MNSNIFTTKIWFLYALIALFLCVFMELIFKKVSRDVKAEIILFYVFLFGTIILGLYFLFSKTNIVIDKTLIVLLLIATLFSVIANTFSIRGLALASNPAYPLAVTKASVLIVAILSVFIFKSEISITKFFAIIRILLGIFLIGL